MFGYITPVQGELTVNDLNKFRTYYCGLCICIKERFGNIPRMFLNYDTTFFAALLDGLSSEEDEVKSSCCIKHPSSKTSYIINNPAINYAADINIALVYYKLLDNILDDNDFKSLSSSKIIKYYYNKITNNTLKNTIHNSLGNLHFLENSPSSYSIDELSHPFSHIMGKILENYPEILEDDSKKIRNNLYNFGYSFGKWIYLLDALDDLQEDINCNTFNPLVKVYNNNLSYNQLKTVTIENLELILSNLLSNCNEALTKIPLKKNKRIIDNVINLGLVYKYMNILDKI